MSIAEGDREGNEGNTYTALQSEYKRRSFFLDHSVPQDGLSRGGGEVPLV